MTIHILPDEVISQIAAGEVVERPASVVKELLENALDACAQQIHIVIKDAGRSLIELADDGLGIKPEEVALAVARHATSKLNFAEDLFHIQTLGFRGEALASVGSVSRLTLTSRFEDATTGMQIHVDGGHASALEQVGVPQGTVVRVENLFYNVPARLKFLKSDSTEKQQINALVTRYAMAYPKVRFRLIQDGRTVLQTSGNGDRREVLANLYGAEIARQMLSVIFDEVELAIEGLISPTSLTRSNRREIAFFVNGRWVQDNSLSAALLKAYHTLLMVGRYPIAALFVTLPPDLVDVNVHPAKAEVRFRYPDRIFSGVQRATRRALLAFTPIPSILPDETLPNYPQSQPFFQGQFSSSQKLIDPAWGMADEVNRSIASTSSDLSGTIGTAPVQPGLPGDDLPLLRLVGQIGATYLIAEGPDGLYLIDQHAAHERVLFERFIKQHDDNLPAQTLLTPVVVELSPQNAELLNDQLPTVSHLGFQIEPFGPGAFRVRSIPSLLIRMDPVDAVKVLVEDFEEDETPLRNEVEAKIIARVCKRAAVKAGQTLSLEEQKTLLRDLEKCQSPRTCPHGRPTMIHLSIDLLERQFGRKGAR